MFLDDLVFDFVFEKVSHHSQAGFELVAILLPQPSEYMSYHTYLSLSCC